MDVRNLLEGRSFVALWGEKLAIYDLERCAFVYSLGELDAGEDAIVLTLDRHLEVLSRGFGLQESVRQLPLFAVSQIGGKEANEGKEILAKEM